MPRSIRWTCCALLLFTSARAAADDVLSLTSHPQLFLDDDLIARENNITRDVQQPLRHADNPLIKQEYPWEERMIEVYGTVLFDSESNKYRCWYLGAGVTDGMFDTPEGPVTAEYFQCYAESDDGIAWTKPLSSRTKFREYERHNVVIPGGHGWCVVTTPDDPDPAKRFKGGGGANFGYSPDGVEWTLHNWRDSIGKNDTGTCIVRWNGEWLAYVRYQIRDPNWPGVMRGVGLSTSVDFEQWTPKELVFKTDEADGYPWTQPYGISVTPYGDQLIALLWLIHLDEEQSNNRHGDMDVQLMTSRDGRNWHRVGDRRPFMTPASEGWDSGSVVPGTNMLVKDDVVNIYYTGKNSRHGVRGATGIGLATLAADRFVAVRRAGDDEPGELETKAFRTDGTMLVVNANTDASGLQVELLDAEGKAIPAFSREKTRLKKRDDLRYEVMWSDGDSTKRFGDRPAGEPVAIRFVLNDGELFAFQVQY